MFSQKVAVTEFFLVIILYGFMWLEKAKELRANWVMFTGPLARHGCMFWWEGEIVVAVMPGDREEGVSEGWGGWRDHGLCVF